MTPIVLYLRHAHCYLAVSDLGATQLKNIAEPVRVYSLEVGVPAPAKPASQAEPTTPDKPSAGLALLDKPSIAVLPFQNMSGDPEQEYFADGMVEEIINQMAVRDRAQLELRLQGQSRRRAAGGARAGRALCAGGTVRKAGDRVRITAQLLESETGAHLWADRYDGKLEDVFDLQDQITEKVVGVVEPSLRQSEIERSRRKRPENLHAELQRLD